MAGSSSKALGQQDAPDAFRHCLRERVRLARELAALRAGFATVAEHYERVHRPEDALVVFGHRRKPSPERRELPRQPHPLPQTMSEGVGRVLLPKGFAARAGHGGDSTSPFADGVLLLPSKSIVPSTQLHKMHTGYWR